MIGQNSGAGLRWTVRQTVICSIIAIRNEQLRVSDEKLTSILMRSGHVGLRRNLSVRFAHLRTGSAAVTCARLI